MAELDERDREVVRLRFYERLGQEDIAQRIGVSQSYLSRLLRKILLQMRERLEEAATTGLTGRRSAPATRTTRPRRPRSGR